jgi:histidine ammonia-lyase
LRYVLAIELMCSAQAHDLLDAGRASEASNAVHQAVRAVVPTVVDDRFFGDDIERLQQLVFDGTVTRTVENVVGTLEF